MGSLFPHYVIVLFISLLSNDPDRCEGFQPKVSLMQPATNMCLNRQTQMAARIYGLNVCLLTYRAPSCFVSVLILRSLTHWGATGG